VLGLVKLLVPAPRLPGTPAVEGLRGLAKGLSVDEESERGLSKALPPKVVSVRGVLCSGDEGRLAPKLNGSVRGVINSGDEGGLAPKLDMLGLVGNVDVKFRSLQARI
jgi:hypothetical protein